MMIDWIAAALPLAASDAPNVLSALMTQVYLWGLVAVGIGLVIFVHELGHFLAAKTFGVKCEKFYVGFDVPIRIGPIKFPRTLGKFTYGETEYGIGILPLGGYVKMLGQDDDPRKAEEEAKRIRVTDGDASADDEDAPVRLDPRSYPAKPVWQRMIIISSGVVMNVITGVLFAAIAFGYGVPYNPAIIGGVTPGGPAWQAGIEPGGQVISVDTLQDSQMHFREMRMAILTAGLDRPSEPIDIAIRYDDGVRHYKLKTSPHPADPDVRMIGITSPTSTTLGDVVYAAPDSAAAKVLTEADAGATVIGFDSTEIDPKAIVPGTPLFDRLYSHPGQSIDLRLRRVNGSEHRVRVPPQAVKSLGLRFAIGPVVSLVANGPAAKAGVNVGDVITAINGSSEIDAYSLLQELSHATAQVQLTLRRDKDQTIEVEVVAADSPQTLSPTSGMGGEIAVNSLGLAYRPLPNLSAVDDPALAAATSAESNSVDAAGGDDATDVKLQPGDQLQEVRLAWTDDDIPDALQDPRYEGILKELTAGWEFSTERPLSALIDAIQILPDGTKLQVLATRPPEDRVVESTVVVGPGTGFSFERGIGFTASESVQRAGSFSEAMTLGIREGKRRLTDVFRFLAMLPRGRVKLRHVGGPLEIVNIAKSEAEKGISPQLMFLTMLSMNLAILNFLPIPALDGGHMVFLIAEAIRGRRVDEQLEMRLTLAGVLALLMLMVIVFANDIIRRM